MMLPVAAELSKRDGAPSAKQLLLKTINYPMKK